MKKYIFLAITLLLVSTSSVFAGDFISRFLEKYTDEKHLFNNVNIGNTMLQKMAANSQNEELKKIFQNLNSIRIITNENKEDSHYYFKKAKELLSEEEFSDFNEVLTLNEHKAKVDIYMKNINDKKQILILIGLDPENKLTIITVTGKIDLSSISKLSGTFEKGEKQKHKK